jgi:TetR/AcrR family transcriptional repressor of lmrAB and yxaGH operons
MVAMMREQGVHATGLTELLARSGTARATLYLHFPRGKAQLVAEATRAAGTHVNRRLAARADQSPAAQVDALIGSWEEQLTRSDYAEGCPVTAAALSGDDSEGAVALAARSFEDWAENLATSLTRAGLEEQAARSLARFVIASVGGAVIWARSARSLQPLSDARTHLHALLDL